jgi:hypothetical protein
VAKHQLIISKDINRSYPVRSEAGQYKATRTLVVNWKGTWAPGDRPELYLVVAPGDELELVLSSEQHQGGSLWLFKRVLPLLLPTDETERQDAWERVDIESGSTVLQVNDSLAGVSGESRYDLRISALGQKPVIIVGEGQPGTLTASKP